MIFKRIRDIVLANVHESLDNLEEPIVLIKQYLRDVEVEIAKAERTIAHQLVSEKRHAALVAETKAAINKRTRQAGLALDTGEEEVARLALQDKVLLESRLATYEAQYETLQAHTATLNEQLRTLQEKYSEMQAKKRFLISRVQATQTQKDLSITLRSIDSESAVRGFNRMEERIEQMEAHAAVSHTILTNHRKLEGLNVDTALQDQVEEELAKLKASRVEA
jgi:phage shock protein A